MASSSKKSNIDYSASSPLTLSMESSILRQQSLSDEDQFNQSASSLITNDKTRQSLESLLLMIPKVSTGQLSHQKMIDGIFSLIIGDQQFDAKNARIQSHHGILLFLELLDKCLDALKATLWSTLTAILKNNIHNLQLCSRNNLIKQAIYRLRDANSHVEDAILELIVVLARHSISVKELKSLMAALKGENSTWPKYSVKLLAAMRQIINRDQTDASVFFNFSGRRGGTIALPPIRKWPTQTGFSIVTWFRLDPLVNSGSTKDLSPYLYCFQNGKGIGYSAYFVESNLMIETITKPKRKGYSHVVNHKFRSRKWYMVGIVYIYNRFRRSELHCYVNGQEVSHDDVSIVSCDEPFHKCFIGSCPQALPSTVFSGQMGSFYTFIEALSNDTMAAIYYLGPDYRCQFKHGFETDVPLSASQEKLLYDGRLSTAIMFTYNPKACDQKLCLESSPTDNATYFVHSPHAIMLEGVYPVITNSFQSALRSLGGIQIIFPLFDQLDYNVYNASKENDINDSVPSDDIGSMLLSLLCDLLRGSTTCQQQIVQGNGFLVLSRLIEKVSPASLEDSTLDTLLMLGKYLFSSPGKANLLNQWIDHILLKASLWIHTSAKVQVKLFSMLATEFVAMPEQLSLHMIDFKRIIGVPRLMHILKFYYWCKITESFNAKELSDGPRPSLSNLLSIRAFILLIIKQLLFKGKGIEDEEMKSLLHYLTSVKEPENLGDVVEFVLSVIYESPSTFVPAFDKLNGIRVICYLLSFNDITIQVNALKIIACFLKYCGNRRKQQLVLKTGLFLVIERRLELLSNILPSATYNSLYEILTEQVNRQILSDKHPDADSSCRLQNPHVFPCMARLIERSLEYELQEKLSANPNTEIILGYSPSMLLKKRILSDLILLLNNNHDNRRLFLQLECWQYWLLVLGFSKNTELFEECKRVSDMTCTVFRILLVHALKVENQGWRIWADTVAFSHIQASLKSYARVQRVPSRNIKSERNVNTAELEKGTCSGGELLAAKNNEPLGNQDNAASLSESKIDHTSNPDNATAHNELLTRCELSDDNSELKDDGIDGSDETLKGNSNLDDVLIKSEENSSDFVSNDQNIQLAVPTIVIESAVEKTDIVAAVDEIPKVRSSVDVEDIRMHEDDLIDANNSEEKGKARTNTDDLINEQVSSNVVTTEEKLTENTVLDSSNSEMDKEIITDRNRSDSGEAITHNVAVNMNSDEVSLGVVVTDYEANEEVTPDTSIDKISKKNLDSAHDGKTTEIELSCDDANEEVTAITSDGKGNEVVPGINDEKLIDVVVQEKETSENKLLEEEIELDAKNELASKEASLAASNLASSSNDSEHTGEALQFTHNESRPSAFGSGTLSHDEIQIPGDSELSSPSVSSDVSSNAASFSQNDKRRQIPSFSWSSVHERLLSDLLFAIENDILSWRSHSRKNISDFVNARENFIYVTNVLHVISMLSDHLIYSCGGIMPLMSSLTNNTGNFNAVQPTQGMEIETAFKFIDRIMGIVDVLVFTSVVGLSPIEADRGFATGGFLRQCLRLTLCSTAFTSLQNQVNDKIKQISFKNIHSDIANLKALHDQPDPMEIYDLSRSMVDPTKLFQDIDMNRLRAVIYRDVEETKQAHHIVSAVLFFISSVTVAKYKEILDSINPPKRIEQTSSNETEKLQSTEGSGNLNLDVIQPRTRANTWGSSSLGTDAKITIKRRFSDAEDIDTVKVPAAVLSLESLSQNQISDIAAESIASQTVTNSSVVEASTDVAFAISSVDNKSNYNKPIDVTDLMESSMGNCVGIIQEAMVDFYPYLSRTFVGSNGQDLLREGIYSLKSGKPVVELIMLLSSQEWQIALQKYFGAAFIELINEGRIISHSVRDQIMSLAKEAKVILDDRLSDEFTKREAFEIISRDTVKELNVEAQQYDRMLVSIKKRHRDVGEYLWKKIYDSLTNELGVWKGDKKAENAIRYLCLDRWEDTKRRRFRLVPNPFGSSHPGATLESHLRDMGQDSDEKASNISYALRARQLFRTRAKISASSDTDDESNRSFDIPDDNNAEFVSSPELDFGLGGPIVCAVECSMLAPGVVLPGNLTLTTSTLYFTVDDDNVETKSIDPQVLVYVNDIHGRWSFDKIRAVYSRRYLLQNCAIEIFLANRRSVMFKFADSQTVKKVINNLPSIGIGKIYGAPRARATSTLIPSRLVRKCNMTQKWINEEISNFEYIMFLNTIAGRTYNDLNQYPIFPWILTNYKANEIDLNDPANYRDLSKPVGALDPHRRNKFKNRYESWQDDEIPAFHYGTHYSTAGFVLAFCLRMEPFSTLFINMQGNKFDSPDRCFSSVAQAWENCQQDTADVKELIPELFYQPDILLNNNKFDLGITSEDEIVNHVKLPPWAKSCHDFIEIHRMALESKYVSQHLHEWIDLIFGYKQRGLEAISSMNVFYYLTYEGNCDLQAIQDPVMRAGIEQQIRNFGQTPSQLFMEPHPPRQMKSQSKDYIDREITMNLVVTNNVPIAYVKSCTQSSSMSASVITISYNQVYAVNKWMMSTSGGGIEIDPALTTPSGLAQRRLGEPMDQSVTPSTHCFCCICENRFILACGYWDKSFKCFSTETGKLTQSIFGHWDVVTCLSSTVDIQSGNNDLIIVSGSRDATILVWSWNGRRERIVGENNVIGDAGAPRAIVTGHENGVVCVECNGELGLIASGSIGGPCLIHTLSGELLHVMSVPLYCQRPFQICISDHGTIAVNFTDNKGYLIVFTANGKLLYERELEERILAMKLSSDGKFIIAGGFRKCIEIWQLRNLRLCHSMTNCDSSVRAIDLSHDERFVVAGLASGGLIAQSINLSKWSSSCFYS